MTKDQVRPESAKQILMPGNLSEDVFQFLNLRYNVKALS